MMIGTSSSPSSSSDASFSSLDDNSVKPNTIKFLCSYDGKIHPRYPDGKLRYVGGETRILSVDRSISYSELQMKLRELCGWSVVSLRCQLPTEDLHTLVSITSDEDLANLIEEYDLASRDKLVPLKIRAFLYPSTTQSKSLKTNGKFPRRIDISIRPAPSKFSARPSTCFQYLVHNGNHWR